MFAKCFFCAFIAGLLVLATDVWHGRELSKGEIVKLHDTASFGFLVFLVVFVLVVVVKFCVNTDNKNQKKNFKKRKKTLGEEKVCLRVTIEFVTDNCSSDDDNVFVDEKRADHNKQKVKSIECYTCCGKSYK